MTDLSEEEKARVARLKELVAGIQQALSGFSKTDVQQALCLLVAQICVEDQHPDRMFLECIDNALAVFRDMTNTKYRNEDPKVS